MPGAAKDITLEALRAELPDDEIIMGKSVIEWARLAKTHVVDLVETRYPKATTPTEKWGAAVASVGMLLMIDAIITCVPEDDRFATFLGVAKDMQMYILNGVDLTKFTVPDDVKAL